MCLNLIVSYGLNSAVLLGSVVPETRVRAVKSQHSHGLLDKVLAEIFVSKRPAALLNLSLPLIYSVNTY